MARCLIGVAAVLASLTASTALAQTTPAAVPPQGELPDTARPVEYRLDLTVDPGSQRFSGRTEIDIELKAPAQTLFLHGNGLNVTRAAVRTGRAAENPVTYSQPLVSGVAELQLARPLAAGRHTLVIDYDAPFRSNAEGLYHVKVGDEWYAWTQMEPLDARRMFPSFDEPRHKTPYTISVTAPAGEKVYANTPLTRSIPAEGGMVRHEFAKSLPLPSYLVAIAVGPFDEVAGTIEPNAVRETSIPLRIIATKGQAPRLTYGLSETPKFVGALETYFGIPYPFEKLDQIASPVMGGAMENAGLITYDDTLLLLGADAPLAQQQTFGNVLAHELAHQWFGNLVTPRWWDDIWLNESFASWMGDKIATQWRPELGTGPIQLSGALSAMEGDSRAVGRPIMQRITRNEDVTSAFDGITYRKGGQVLEMFEGFLGEERFRQGVQAYLNRFPHGTATSEDFFQSIGSVAGDPRIVPAFQSFVTQQGVPLVTVRQTSGGYELTQQRYLPIGVAAGEPQRWIVPVCARTASSRACTLLEGEKGTLAMAPGDWILPNAGATGYYRFDLDPAGWEQLIAAAPGFSGEEAMVVADSVWASFKAGRAPFSTVLAVMSALSGHEERLAATYIPYKIDWLAQTAFSAADRKAYGVLINRLFRDRLAVLGVDLARGAYAKEEADRSQLRQALLGYVALDGQDPAYRSQLVDAADAAIAGNAAALDPAFRPTALSVAVQERGAPFMDRVLEALATSQDPLFRRQAASALGAANTPELARHSLAMISDSRLQNLEKLFILRGLLEQDDTRDLAFSYTIENFQDVQNLAAGFNNFAWLIGSGFCTTERAAAVNAALRPRLAGLGAGQLDLDRSLAGITECAALKAAKGDEISQALARGI